ncbi:rhodanese-like domain-containing protein [Thiocystis violascens]|uniref:rhodanese-like domain-containing protein n=1 Tax=Thiocystis violascens TaxID=73141 RepID=UPI0002D445DA|nr:rhodanese-like domain-containing protein [Thiocystis violascens]
MAGAYDAKLAESYANLFMPVQGLQAGKALHCIKPEAFVNRVKRGEPMVTLDVRTPAETGIFTAALPGHLTLSLHELFLPANLARIPKDRTVVVLCKSGLRASAAGTALRHIGFENVFILEGGFKALVDYLDPMTANQLPAVELVTSRIPREVAASLGCHGWQSNLRRFDWMTAICPT